MAGVLGAELFLTRMPILGVIGGTILFVLGLAAPAGPGVPAAVPPADDSDPGHHLQPDRVPAAAARVALRRVERCSSFDIPVLREGNVITLANTQLEVAEACSGIRSLISLLTLGIVYGYFMHPSVGVRWLLALSTIPVAIIANGMRVAGTGIAAHYYGPEAAEGFFHTFSGWLVFIVALAMLFLVHRVIVFFAPGTPPRAERPPRREAAVDQAHHAASGS